MFFWGGRGGEEGATKLSQNFPNVSPSFAKILAKLHALKISKKNNTSAIKE